MVKNPFKRKPKNPSQFQLIHLPISVSHTVTVKKEPDPRPTMGYLIWTNQTGQRWQSTPFRITGQASFPIDIPIAWLTGRDKDIAKLPLNVILMLEY